MDETNEVRYTTIMWLLTDFINPDDFVAKLSIVGNQFMRRLESTNEKEITQCMLVNIALAFCRIEASSMSRVWSENIKPALSKFIIRQVYHPIGFLWLKNELSIEAIDVLMASTLIRQNAEFRKLMGLAPPPRQVHGHSIMSKIFMHGRQTFLSVD